MAIVSYNGGAIIPAPFVSLTDESLLSGSQRRLGTTYRLQIIGTIVSFKGSPASAPFGGGSSSSSWGLWNNQFWITSGYPPDESNPSASLHQLYMIESKQEALRNLFSTEGLWLEFQSADGSQPLKCQPKNIVITFQDGLWFQECKYQISAECDALYLNGQILNSDAIPEYIQNATENWNITPSEVIKTFGVSHNVSAIGKRTFDAIGNESLAWQNAKSFVNSRLVLGWSGISAFSNIAGGTIFQQSSLASGALDLSIYFPYNYSRVEDVDELAGSYGVTESWLLAAQASGTHVYSVSTQRISQDPYTTVTAQIQGTIKGFYVDLFDYDSRLANANYVWQQLNGPTGLVSLLTQVPNSGFSYNIQPRQGSIDYNYNEGSISYQYEFSNTLYQSGDAFEQYTINRKTSVDSYLTIFGIQGSIKGRRFDGDTNVLASFNRAYSYWVTATGNNYDLLYQRIISNTYFPEASGMQIQHAPIAISVDYNQSEGTITYQFEYNNRVNDYNGSNNVLDEWNTSKHFSVTEGISTYTLQGSVKGLNITDINPRYAKYNAATGYYYTYVKPNIYSRVTGVYQLSLPNTNPFSTEESFFPVEGMVQYNFQFNNWPAPILSGVLSEVITVNEVNYNQQVTVIGNIPILGRSVGPILQQMNTSVAKERRLTIETVMAPTGGSDLLSAFNTKPNYDTYALQLVPQGGYCTEWNDQWSWRDGRYSLNVNWIYE